MKNYWAGAIRILVGVPQHFITPFFNTMTLSQHSSASMILCVAIKTAAPFYLQYLRTRFNALRWPSGSIPLVISSKRRIFGLPINAIIKLVFFLSAYERYFILTSSIPFRRKYRKALVMSKVTAFDVIPWSLP